MNPTDSDLPERDRLIGDIARAYMDLYIAMQAVTVAHWLSLELTFTQVKALMLLNARKALTVSQLAKLLGVGNPTASILVQKLVELELVTRSEDPADRRQTVLRLSEKGAAVGAGRRKEREAQWQNWLSRLSDEDLDALARGLAALMQAVQAEGEILTQ
jgi:MarR family transcriptional regulator, organic hydroperoxide resistance regulator